MKIKLVNHSLYTTDKLLAKFIQYKNKQEN